LAVHQGTDLLLEEGEAFPGGEGVAVDGEGGGDVGGGLAGDEESGGAELVGGEGSVAGAFGWRALARVGRVWRALARGRGFVW